MNNTIVQYKHNSSNKKEDINSLNESVASIQDEVNVKNDIIKDKRKNIPQKVYSHTNCKPKIMMLILKINRVTKITITITIKMYRTIV